MCAQRVYRLKPVSKGTSYFCLKGRDARVELMEEINERRLDLENPPLDHRFGLLDYSGGEIDIPNEGKVKTMTTTAEDRDSELLRFHTVPVRKGEGELIGARIFTQKTSGRGLREVGRLDVDTVEKIWDDQGNLTQEMIKKLANGPLMIREGNVTKSFNNIRGEKDLAALGGDLEKTTVIIEQDRWLEGEPYQEEMKHHMRYYNHQGKLILTKY